MQASSRRRALSPLGALGLWLAATGVAACGKPSRDQTMVGTYATDAVQAEAEEHEKEFVSEDLRGRFDSLDKAEAAQGGAVWARLRLKEGGRFEYEGPASEGGAPDARLAGRWTARAGFVDLAVEQAVGPGAADLPRRLACPAAAGWIDLVFLTDVSSHRPVRLGRR